MERFMPKVLFALVLLSSQFAWAAGDLIQFTVVGFESEKVGGIAQFAVYPGKNAADPWEVVQNPNTCDGDACSVVGLSRFQTQPTIASDRRAADGPLVIELVPMMSIEVESGDTPDGNVHYTAVLKQIEGPTVRLPLHAVVATTATPRE
jgi:hypothetical protein